VLYDYKGPKNKNKYSFDTTEDYLPAFEDNSFIDGRMGTSYYVSPDRG